MKITEVVGWFSSQKYRTKQRYLRYIGFFLSLLMVNNYFIYTFWINNKSAKSIKIAVYNNISQNNIDLDLYRKPLLYGPIEWSAFPIETKNTFYEFYDIHCPKTHNISRSRLVVTGNFNDDRNTPKSNIPSWLMPFVDYKTKGKLKWDVKGILYGLESFEELSQTPEGCGHSGYPNSCQQFLDLFDKYPNIVYGKNVLVIGSITPWIEIILMHFGANVTTTDYNIPTLYNPSNIKYDINDIKLNIISIQQLFNNNNDNEKQFKYDIIVSYSCLEHDGLGRYGDPINPNGDFASMNEFYYLLKNEKKSYLFLSIPLSSRDYIIWNSHRFYGECRFEYLIKDKFQIKEAFGSYDNERFITLDAFKKGSVFIPNNGNHQPLILLQKILQ